MGIARVSSRAQLGLSAPRVDVEVHLGSGLPNFGIVGLPATAVKESKDRVRAALQNSGFEFPAGRITVNLSPADLPKEGCRYDLPIALGILLASEQIKPRESLLGALEFYGELGLAGELKPVHGVLLAAAHAARDGRAVVVPAANLAEAQLVADGSASGADHLLGVCDLFANGLPPTADRADKPAIERKTNGAGGTPALDLHDVRGQAQAKRALIVAAAGGHSLLLVGPPGTGKSMLAQRLPGLLPELQGDEALDVASIASISTRGFEPSDYGRRPFRAPHHTASASAIIGGGRNSLPGEASLAHRGVLFLDELPEFNRRVLESLREPLETGVVAISRAAMQVEYPARFQLVAAMNPCPCGYLGDVSGRCRCAASLVAKYRARISGPLLDRIDLRVEVPSVPSDELLGEGPPRDPCASTPALAGRIARVRTLQRLRAGKLNADLSSEEIDRDCALDRPGRLLLAPRGLHRVLRVARTVADLEEAAQIRPQHLGEALQLRREMATG